MAILKNDRNELLDTAPQRIVGASVTLKANETASIVFPRNSDTATPATFDIVAEPLRHLSPTYSWSYRFGTTASFTPITTPGAGFFISLDSTTPNTLTINAGDPDFYVAASLQNFLQVKVDVTDTKTNSSTHTISFPILREGYDTPILELLTNDLTFVTEKNSGNIVPTNISITAAIQNFTYTSISWYVDDILVPGATGTTFTVASFNNVESKKIKAVATDGTTELYDVLTIYSLREGNDAIVAGLTNENQSVACLSDGTPLAGAFPKTSQFTVIRGTEVLTTGVTYSKVSETGMVSSINSTTGEISISSIASNVDTAEAVYRATAGTLNLDKKLTLSKVRAGGAGNPGVAAFLTNPTHDLLSDSSGTVYAAEYDSASTTFKIFEGGVDISDNIGWTYSVVKYPNTTALQYQQTGNTFKITSLTVDSGYLDITASRSGYSNLALRFSVTRLSESADGVSPRIVNLTASNQAVTYDKSGLTPSPTSVTITAKTQNTGSTSIAYKFLIDDVELATVTNTTGTASAAYTVPSSFFSTPKSVKVEIRDSLNTFIDDDTLSIVATKVGETGTNTATVYLYARNSSTTTAPTFSPGTLTYTFATKALSSTVTNWYAKISDAPAGTVMWVRQAVVAGNTDTVAILSTDWSSATIISKDGEIPNISNLLDKTATSYLTGTIVPENSGSVKVGDLTWSTTTGQIIGGSGVALTPKGILAAKNATATVTIGIDGTATFAGDVRTSGDGYFAGQNTSTDFLFIAQDFFYVDYSIKGNAATGNSASNMRAGILGVANAEQSAYNVGVIGKGTGTGYKGIGVLGEGTAVGGYFTSTGVGSKSVRAINTQKDSVALETVGSIALLPNNTDTDFGAKMWLSGAQNPASTTVVGGITVDIYKNKLRFYESGGTNRGVFVDLASCQPGIGSDLISLAGGGTVTSVALSVPTGLTVSGGPITTNGTIAISLAAGYSIPTTASQTNWDTAYTDRNKWDGNSAGLNAATGRTSLGLGSLATQSSITVAQLPTGTANGNTFMWTGSAWTIGGNLNAAIASIQDSAGTTITSTTNNAIKIVGDRGISVTGSSDTLKVSKKTVKIAIIGDSLSQANIIRTNHWIDILKENIEKFDTDVTIIDLAIGGYTFYKANTQAVFNSNTRTMVQECVANSPDIVLVALGLNDIDPNISTRTLAQLQSDASSVFSALNSGLPNAKIVYISELAYDHLNFNPSTANSVKNKGVIPAKFTLPSSGVLAGCYSPEILENIISSTTQTTLNTWKSLDTYIKGLTSYIDRSFTYYHWRSARLGLFLHDGLHHNDLGSRYLAIQVFTELVNAGIADTGFYALYPNLVDGARSVFGTKTLNSATVLRGTVDHTGTDNSYDLFFAILSTSGTGYVTNYTSDDYRYLKDILGPFRRVNPDNWYLPTKGYYTINKSAETDSISLNLSRDSIATVTLTNTAPNSLVYKTVDNSTYSSTGYYTDSYGNVNIVLVGADFSTAGSYTMRLKVSNEVYAPIYITVSATVAVPIIYGGTGATTAANARTNLGLGTLATISPTGTASSSTYLRGDGTWSSISYGSVALTDLPTGTANGNTFMWTGSAWTIGGNLNAAIASIQNSAGTTITSTTNNAIKIVGAGNLDVTGSGSTLTVGVASGYAIPTTTKQTNWDTAYTDRNKWDGGSTGLVAATGRTSLGLGSLATQSSITISQLPTTKADGTSFSNGNTFVWYNNAWIGGSNLFKVIANLVGNTGSAAVTLDANGVSTNNDVNILGSTTTGITNAYVKTTGSGNTLTLSMQTTSPSDRRVKHEIEDIGLGLDFISKLRPVSYRLIADPKQQQGFGFIADEVEGLIGLGSSLVYEEPEYQVGDITGIKTIHYPSYVAVLVKAVQELSSQVQTLQEEVAALKAR